MDLAAERLPPDGLIATTDADSEPDPDWLRAQLDAVAAGARAIGGRVEVGAHDLPPAAIRRREADAVKRHAALVGAGAREHHQFSGASLAVTAATYAQVGRLEPRDALEDEGFERALHRHGVPIERLAAVRVTTSGRRIGRARRGLAVDLRRNSWLAERSYQARDFSLQQLLEAKDRSVSVILPTREVAGDAAGRARRAQAAASPDRRTARRRRRLARRHRRASPRTQRARRLGIGAPARSWPRARQGRRDVARPRRDHRRARLLPRHRHRGLRRAPSCSACSARC